MNLRLRLGDSHAGGDLDAMGRPGEQYRGRWTVDAGSDEDRYVTFGCDGEAVLVAELNGVADVAISPRGPVTVTLWGRFLPDTGTDDVAPGGFFGVDGRRAPRATEAPRSRVCACGCGGRVPRSALFVPGHDKKAVHERIGQRWGSLNAFIQWFDGTEPVAVEPGASVDAGGATRAGTR